MKGVQHSGLLVVLGLGLAACAESDGATDAALDAALIMDAAADAGPADTGAVDSGEADSGEVDAGPPPPFELTSTAFGDGEPVPVRYQCGPPLIPNVPGLNVSPQLAWTAGPPGTASYALVVRDLSAGGLVHWAIYDIDAAEREIAEDVPAGYEPPFPAAAKQAEIQGSGYFGYFGPCSGGRGNRYEFTLHAIGTPTLAGVDMSTSERVVATTVEAASMGSASFIGIY